jgi:hypothetical protein
MSQPEIITVNSESLEAEIRTLLPSQAGFGSELQASNVITPIIDLTPTASGSNLPEYMQTAINHDGSTNFNVTDASTTLTSVAGFWRISCVSTVIPNTSGAAFNNIAINDGSADKNLWVHGMSNPANQGAASAAVDVVFFLRPGDSLIAKSNGANATLCGSVRQVATSNGTLVNPVGFTLE